MAWVENRKGQVLLVQQAQGRKPWTLPGGKVKAGEALDEALDREVYEETALHIRTAQLIDVYDRSEQDTVTLLYRATLKRATRGQQPRVIRPKEIADLRYLNKLPSPATATARHFWRRCHRWQPLSAFLRKAFIRD
jgi:ADP-ribose pyrophosphatase YjhB (NUDIX family)